MKTYLEYKDSGIEWIGRIPKDWTVSKISRIATTHNGDRGINYPSGNDFVDDGIPFVSSPDLIDGKSI